MKTLFLFLLACAGLLGQVSVPPGTGNLQTAVSANPAGTTFILQAGVHRDAVTALKTGDTFTGQAGAIMNGSTVLTGWTQVTISGVTYWTTAGGTPLTSSQSSTQCEPNYPGCYLTQDLYFDNVTSIRRTTLAAVTTGSWYYDTAGGDGGTVNNVYMTDNPTGQTVELGTSYSAFISSNINNITIKGPLILEKYANNLQHGTIECSTGNSGWAVAGSPGNFVETRLSHGAGISGLPGCSGLTVTYNYTHHNGMFGWTFGAATAPSITQSICTYNNVDNVLIGFGAGCMKKGGSGTGGYFSHNVITNNHGIGYWSDDNSSGDVYDSSLIYNNDGEGIRIEISSNATITNNTIFGNGNGTPLESGINGPQVTSASSSGVIVRGNWVTSNNATYGGAIQFQYNNARGGCGTGCTTPSGMSGDHNFITLTGTTSQGPLLTDNSSPSTFSSWVQNNMFDYNTYCVAAASWTNSSWNYNGTLDTVSTWQSTNNQDQHGSIAYNTNACATIVITSPTPAQTVTGYAYNLTATVASAPAGAYVSWTIDGEKECTTRTPPFTCSWDPFNNGNGPRLAVATLYNALNAVIATSAPVSFTVANTMPVFNTNSTYTPNLSVAVSGPGTCTGTTWTGSCTLTATLGGTYPTGSGLYFGLYVDGSLLNSADTSAAQAVNTALFTNGPHQVVYTYNSGFGNVWVVWEQQITFSNGATHLWLESQARETWLCATASTSCPTSVTYSGGTIVNTDGTTEAATLTSCTILTVTVSEVGGPSTNYALNTGIVTQSGAGGCTLTAASNGSAEILLTESGGLTRPVWIFVYSTNVTQSFGNDGRIHNQWISGTSVWIASMFFSNGSLTNYNGTNPAVSPYLANYKLAGWNTVEPGISTYGPSAYQGCATITTACIGGQSFQTIESNNVLNWSSWALANGMYLHLNNDAWWRNYQFYATRGTQETYSPHGFTALLNYWGAASHVIGIWIDEINSYGGSAPQQAAPKMGNTITQVVASLGTCVATTLSGTPPGTLFSFENDGIDLFTITGATSAGFNSAPGTYYKYSSSTATSFTWPCPSVANGTYNSSTDPNMLFEVGYDNGDSSGGAGPGGMYQLNPNLAPGPATATGVYGGTYTGGITATGTGTCILTFSNGGGSGATARVQVTGGSVASALTITALGSGFTTAPTTATVTTGSASSCTGPATVSTSLTDYTRWNQYQVAMNDYFAATNPPLITWTNAAGASLASVQDFMYDPREAQFAEVYSTAGNVSVYRPEAQPLPVLLGWMGDRYRAYLGKTTEPFLMETQGEIAFYGMQGVPVPVSTCSGNTFTFSSPHGIYNVVPWSTRFSVASGSCAGNYWVIAAPTATTLTVWTNFGSTLTSTSGNGTLTFASGHVYNLPSGYNVTATSSTTAISQQIGGLTASGGNYPGCERGATFTFSGFTGPGAPLNGTTGYFPFNYPNGNGSNCSTWSQGGNWVNMLWGAIPNLSGSGGTATIIANNYFTFGRNASQVLVGPVFQSAGVMYCVVMGCAGERAYLWGNSGSDPEGMTNASAQNAYYNTSAYNLNSVFTEATAGTAPNQFGIMPGTGNPFFETSYWAMATMNNLAHRLAKYEFQSHLPSPDYGPFIEASAHSGAPGNMQVLQNLAMNNQTVTVNLSSCDVPGQQKIRYLADYTGIVVSILANGVTSDTPVMTSGGTVAYLCPQNFADELQQPTITARLADVPNATKIVVRYAYLPYWVDNGTAVADCSSGTCALPVDRQLGPVYYRLIYLNANSQILAVSAVQIL